MSATLPLRRLILGDGTPRIIVPIVGTAAPEILQSAQAIAAHPHADLAEWRADHFEHAPDAEKTCAMLQSLREILGDKPLLYTFRTAREGGEKEISPSQYTALCHAAAVGGHADLIDVEMFSPAADACVKAVHACGVPVIGSWHDFEQTPSEKDLLTRFRIIQEKGADVLKIAVMPHSSSDVEHLIAAAQTMHLETQRPLCAMSMGEIGRITRTHCQQFGGCMTFGTLGAASAPGQISVDALHKALKGNISPL